MSIEEKKNLLADILDLEADDLQENTVLEDLDTWDSIAALSVAAMMDEQFGKDILASDIRNFKTVGDLLAIMEK